MSVKTHWQVVNRTYPMPRPHTITEFEFGNGVSIHYNPEPGEMTIFLPTKESYLSVGSTHEVVQEDQVEVELERTEGVLTTITIRREEDAL